MSQTTAPPSTYPVSPEPQPRYWTRAEYLRLIDLGVIGPHERVELIGGRIYRMSPQKNRHAAAVTLAHRACLRCFPAGFWVRVQMTLALPGQSMPEPDVAVVPGELEDHPEDYPETAVLIIQAAESTLAFDRWEKASLYAGAGIPEYWIQVLAGGLLEVRRDPQPDPSAPYGWNYSSVKVLGREESLSPLAAPSCVVAVRELLRQS